MNKFLILLATYFSLVSISFTTYGKGSYIDYHKEIVNCEELIVKNKFAVAINKFDSLFTEFQFVFLRDIKVATQICAREKNINSGFRFIRLGISNGWALEDIMKSDELSLFHEDPEWEKVLSEYDSLYSQYSARLNIDISDQVIEMFKNDQKKALRALFRIGQKKRIKYAENKFAPHSEMQLAQFKLILDQYGYPGELLIGDNLLMSVILSHHNSISVNYNLKDTLTLA